MNKQILIDKMCLEKVQNKSLFYPCSGGDYLVPIEIFSPYVTDFWFVDRMYFLTDRPADKARPVLENDTKYELLSKQIDGPSSWPPGNLDITPCTLTESYRHIETDRIIRIHRRRGYGFSALANENRIRTIGVFFYRGDSPGNGGSGNHWLIKEHLEDVLEKLVDGGLLALDGSDGTGWSRKSGIYKEICKYTCNTSISLTPEELVASMNVVKDYKNREYHCVGYAGMRYGPTMIWQVHGIAQPDAAPNGDSATPISADERSRNATES